MNRRNEEKEGDITWESITKAREKTKAKQCKGWRKREQEKGTIIAGRALHQE